MPLARLTSLRLRIENVEQREKRAMCGLAQLSTFSLLARLLGDLQHAVVKVEGMALGQSLLRPTR